MFVKIENGNVKQYPYTLEQMYLDNPNVSFPRNMSQKIRESFGIFDVIYEGSPKFDPNTHRVVTSASPVLIDGKWTLTKTIEEQTPEQIAINTANKAAQVRSERNKRISTTDWTQLADSKADKNLWATYRQSLRDITSQCGFPYDITWPEAP
jgi:hypothetical protein